MKALIALAALLVLACAAPASPRAEVDRDRLRKATVLPTRTFPGWYYSVRADGRTYEAGQEPELLDISETRARLQGNDTDLDRWRDLAAAYRVSGDSTREAECHRQALTILRRRVADRPDDGETLASLGLALLASGDDAGADEAIRSAERAPKNAWAGIAALGDVLVIRATGKAADIRLATVDDAIGWFKIDPAARSRLLDRARLDSAMQRYDDAVAGLEKATVTGVAAASVYMRRCLVVGLCLAIDEGIKPDPNGPAAKRATADFARARDLLPADPYAITITALHAAMSAPRPSDGVQQVQSLENLSGEAQSALARHLIRLEELAGSSDAEIAARAHQGIACVNWFCRRDLVATEASLRKSVAKDPHLEQSWSALVLVIGTDQRMDDLEKLARDRVQAADTATSRTMLAAFLALRGRSAEAEKEARRAVALDSTGYLTNGALAVLVLRNSVDGADLSEVPRLLDSAESAWKAAQKRYPSGWFQVLVARAVWQGLIGDLDAAEASARNMLESEPTYKPAKEILAAIGR